jgi:hypothetical protein
MFSKLIIEALPDLVKFFKTLNLNFYYSKPQMKHFGAFIIAMLLHGYNGKVTDVSMLALNANRTSIGRFLASDAWDEKYLLKSLNEHVLAKIIQLSQETNLPIYVIIDDTICEKTVPSSKAKQPIEGCGFHQSHLQNKIVYGHQFVTVMLRCGDITLPYNIVLYEKEERSKIEIASSIIASLPTPPNKGYVLTDSWYSCQALFEASLAAGYQFIGAIKSNRKIYPRGYRKKGIQLGAFARSLRVSDFDLVTVSGRCYYQYTYLGKINGMRKVKIVLSWPKESLFLPATFKAFISTDINMSGKQLCYHYTKRWPIEVFFREANRRLGMKRCQVHSKKAVIRYQYILMLAYTFCGMEVNGDSLGFSKKRLTYQADIKRFQLRWVYNQALNNTDFEEVCAAFHMIAT